MDFMAGRMGSISSGTDEVVHPSCRSMKPVELFSELPDELPEERLASVALPHLIRQKDNKEVNV